MWHPRENRKGLRQDFLIKIFKKYAINHRQLDFKGFQKVIQCLALEYFKNRDDKKENMKHKVPFFKPPQLFRELKREAVDSIR